jgi:uncharacterized protein (DUF4415 family)
MPKLEHKTANGEVPDPELIDEDNPEWTDEMFARAVPLSGLPQELQDLLSSRKRGPQKTPTKQLVSLRLSPEVLAHFKATGPGWQRRIDETLKSAVRKAS